MGPAKKTTPASSLIAEAAESTASEQQYQYRDALAELYRTTPLPEKDLLFNLGMFVRSSLLVKFIVMGKLYERIKDIPGSILEFGTWWGQNLVLFENLRAIYEPFNKQRRIIGFDTFTGYQSFSEKDKASDVWVKGSYSTGHTYQAYLKNLLEVHEGNNILGHVRGIHELVAGDVTVTVPEYFEQHPETIVALAYFDLGLHQPTRAALAAVMPHLVPGSVLLFDELTWKESPGEALAFKELLHGRRYRIEKEALYPSKSIVTLLQ